MDTPDIRAWPPTHLNVLVVRLSQWLFAQDPMHTCCVENDAFDEYDAVACSLVEQLAEGDAPYSALQAALTTWFGEELVNEAPLEPLAHSLSELLATDASERGDDA